MKIGIMQPYFLPYIGYWQLMNAVDMYVIYDDVNYIKGGWIGRNRILVNGQPKYLNIELIKPSPNKLINEINVNNDERIIRKKLRMIEGAYKKAPQFGDIYPIVVEIMNCKKENIVNYIENSFKIICEYLDIKTELILSSNLEKDCTLRGQDKVLDICGILNATEYYNAVGGQDLYNVQDFETRGIKLKFLESDNIQYKQFDNEFQANLSILDVMMFNTNKEVQEMLDSYVLI